MIFSWKKVGYLVIAALIFTSCGNFAAAQTIENIDSYDTRVNEGDFDFEITPENPGPFTPVTIKLSSNLVDTNRYPIEWRVDGMVTVSGVGQRVINVQTKDYGQTITISMSIQLIDSVVTKQIV